MLVTPGRQNKIFFKMLVIPDRARSELLLRHKNPDVNEKSSCNNNEDKNKKNKKCSSFLSFQVNSLLATTIERKKKKKKNLIKKSSSFRTEPGQHSYYDTKVLTSARIVFLHIGHAWKEEPHSWQKQKWPQGSKVRATGRWRHWRHVLRAFSRLFSALRARNLSSRRLLSNLALSSATALSLLATRFRSHDPGRPGPEQGLTCVGPWPEFGHVALT